MSLLTQPYDLNSHLLLVTHSSLHHATHSGYSVLADHLPGVRIPKRTRPLLPYRLLKHLASSRHNPYDSNSVNKEFEIFLHIIKNRKGIIQFFNGERDFYYTRYWAKRLKWNSIATFHKPPALLHEQFSKSDFMRKLDGAFAVGSNQVEYLQHLLGHKRVWFVPHGIDVDFFMPTHSKYEPFTCLFVGQHMRDFEMLDSIVSRLSGMFPNFKLVAILRKEAQALLPNSPNVISLSNISDEELRRYYQTACLLLLPLKDVTACNAILEALACGLPIITNDIGGIRDYLDESCAVITPHKSVDAIVDAVSELMTNETLNLKMRRAARQRALHFTWPKVAKNIAKIYSEEFQIDVFN
jgi:glycosyltransferase involved in cell wall biosynthesis